MAYQLEEDNTATAVFALNSHGDGWLNHTLKQLSSFRFAVDGGIPIVISKVSFQS
jgi:hypothetical protein